MAKLFIDALIFGLSLQIVCYLFWVFNFFGGITGFSYPLGNSGDMLSSGVFDLTSFGALVGISAAIGIGIAALLLRQGVYAIFAMLLFGIGIMFTFIKGFFLAIPNTIGAFLPNSTNPLPMNPDGSYPLNPILLVIIAIYAFAAWMYLFGLVIQREVM